MSLSTFQKVTLGTCLVLCVALLLPKMLLSRGKKDESSGRFPPMLHRQMAPDVRGQRTTASHLSKAHGPDTIARAKGAGTGAGTGGKSNLAGQIIPVYGFGILLYILYILFKITSKGSSKPAESVFPSVRSENMKRKITDFELAQLQEKLRETELVIENIVSKSHHSPDREGGVTADQEASLLQHLTEITRVMQEGQLVEGTAAEKKTQDDWDDYPEESHLYWEKTRCSCHHQGPQVQKPEADSTDVMEDSPEHIMDRAEAQKAENLNKESFTAAKEAPKTDLGTDKEVKGENNLGVPEAMTGIKEPNMELRNISQPAEKHTTCSQVRRRKMKEKMCTDMLL
ncbi:protein RIC-3b isoform X2 [Thalassophryne amazonica]|uniref:protein RIC-3b isoform X2 n=1 Tax=Thalassophryne amazonica TaxID=390379 RepID=UPI001470E458|nr:protein RIC-3b isoform X2 [Thalassophryne amazonica]